MRFDLIDFAAFDLHILKRAGAVENFPANVVEAAAHRFADMTVDRRAELARAMNDMLMQDYVIIPLLDRGRVSAHSNTLGGVILNTWDSELWNAADWHRVSE